MAKRRVGRPPFKPTALTRRKVEELAAAGMAHIDIAKNLGVTFPTMFKYYQEELSTGAAKRQGEIIQLLFKSARAKSVTAQKALYEMMKTSIAEQSLQDRFGGEGEGGSGTGQPAVAEGDAATAKSQKLGKKEEAQQAAEKVGGIFAVPAAPKLVVSN